MRKNFIPGALCILMACNEPGYLKESAFFPGDDAGKDASSDTAAHACYESKTGSNIVELSLHRDGNSVTGTLTYLPDQKDKNTGTIEGRMHGDTLLANYTFMSEGVESVREVIFLKTASGYKEGYGAVKDQSGKMVFENWRNADF